MNRSRLGRSAVVGAVLGILAVGALATGAVAHTGLADSAPREGETLAELDRVRLEFTGVLLDVGATLMVTGADVKAMELEVEFVSETAIEADVPALDSGQYTLEWRVVSEDGHPIEGQIPFTMEVPETVQPSLTPDTSPSPSTPAPVPSATASDDVAANGDFGEKVSQSLSPLDALLIALVGAVLVAIAWFITRRVSAREHPER